jgi:preprotein translocase subunit SecE
MGRLKRKKTLGQKKSAAAVADKAPLSEAAEADTPATGEVKTSPDTGAIAKKITLFKKSSKPVKTVIGKKKQNIIDKSLQFLREVKVELKKVTWPSRKQTIGSTVVVLILAMIISLFLGVVDMGLSGLIRVVLN